jgi:hypothetical protein
MLNAIEDAIKRPEDETHIAEHEAQMASSLAGIHNRDHGLRAKNKTEMPGSQNIGTALHKDSSIV